MDYTYYYYNTNNNPRNISSSSSTSRYSSLSNSILIPSSSSSSPPLQPTKITNTNPNSNKKREKMKNKAKGVVKLSSDPQSVAARERRHRISDRFKILQSLVPGGSKLDTVSMLDQAIQYVKFLKSQIWLHQTILNHTPHDYNAILNHNHNYDSNNYDYGYSTSSSTLFSSSCPSHLDSSNDPVYCDQYCCYYNGLLNNNNNNNNKDEAEGEVMNMVGEAETVGAAATTSSDYWGNPMFEINHDY